MFQLPSRSWVYVATLALGLGVSGGAMPALAAAPAGPPAGPPAGVPTGAKKPPAKKPLKKAGPKSSALSAALNDKGPQIQQCAVDHGMLQGAQKVEIDVHVTINKSGAVVDAVVTTNVTGKGDNDKVKDCVESLVKAAKFPAVATPLATAERSWTVAEQ